MPYYIHLKDIDITTANIDLWDLPTFDTAAKANGAIADRNTHKVSFRASTDESRTWRERERSRFSNGEYIGVPWSDSYAGDNGGDHYAHLSIKTPGLIAFTKSPEHGVQDRQTTMRPGKYLQEFYNGQFDLETVAQYIAACAAEHLELQIATSVDDVVAVYMNTGITSCMDGNHFKRASTHPCRVYGDSDLGVAYYGPIDDINARAVVWSERKIYSRLYGNTSVLERLLQKIAGWTKGSLKGARIRAIDSDHGGYVIPYIDYIDGAEVDGKWLVLGDGDISCNETQGYSDASRYAECEHCGLQIYEDESYCESCENQRATCNNCDRTIWTNDDEYTQIRHGALCESCAADATNTCQGEDCDETWIDGEVFSSREQRERAALHVDDLCVDCASHHRYCDACEQVCDTSEETDHDGRCDCGHAFRCEHTRELPLTGIGTSQYEDSHGVIITAINQTGDPTCVSPF